ncbi:MAG: DUF4355 domain-containing protein [Clostridium sp.]|nr:MAG TPA: Major capsid protein [Caudoviricetes sp.]
MENNKLDMNLQLLAEGNEGGEEPPQDNHIDNTNNGEGGESKVLNITQEELDRMFDRKYSQWQKKANEKVKQAEIKARQQVEKEQEAQRLAKMTENERLQEQVRQANANYEKLQRSMELRDLNEEKRKQLKAYDISEEYADFIVGDNADEIHANLEKFKTLKQSEKQAFERRIEEEVEKRVSARLKNNGNFKDIHQQANLNNQDTSEMSDDEFYRQYFASKNKK